MLGWVFLQWSVFMDADYIFPLSTPRHLLRLPSQFWSFLKKK